MIDVCVIKRARLGFITQLKTSQFSELINFYNTIYFLYLNFEHSRFQQRQTKTIIHSRNYFYIFHKVRFKGVL